jgi:hypothetical protein
VDIKDIQETEVWRLFEKGRNYHRMRNIYTDTDRNYRFYNGNQWEGAKLDGVEALQKNFIKPIVKYKVSVIHDNLYGIVYSSENFESREFQKESAKYCDMLNRYAARVWEKDKMDFKGRRITKDAAINDEGILYVDFDKEKMIPVNEIVKKNDFYLGNENDDDIQSQPYILIRKRMPQSNAIEFARGYGVGEENLKYIVGDKDNFEESGDDAKFEVDDMVSIIFKMYKKDGLVSFSVATKWLDIAEDVETGLKLYPVAHMVWEEKEGSSRGEGEVRTLIPNQIEVNRIEVRRAITTKYQAFPRTIVDTSKISNTGALDSVGGLIETNGMPVDDVNKIVGTLAPAQMSPDVVKLQEDLIQMTRDLAGAGDTATGQVNPESASGRAILAVEQASKAPMTEQKEGYKNFIEDVAKIWLDYLIVHSKDGVNMEQVEIDPQTGEEVITIVRVPQSVLERLQATVKIDVTPKGVYDKFAMEQSMENLLTAGLFNAQRMPELKLYVQTLDDDSVMPKQKLMDMIEAWDKEQRKIAQIEAQAQLMQQRAMQFINEDPDGQANQIADARMQMMAQREMNTVN